MKHMKTVICALILWTACTPIKIHAYTERNLLQNQISKADLKEILQLNQSWVTYPAYEERQEWNDFLVNIKIHSSITENNY